MKRIAIVAGTIGVFVLAYMRCSEPEFRAHVFDYRPSYQASSGCRDVYSCSSCTASEKCEVTEHSPDGWPTKRECCPK